MSSLLQAILQRTDVWRGAAPGVAAPGIASGFAALDAALPGGGWPTGCLVEILPRHEGIGELRLLGPALAGLARSGRCLAWIAPPHLPYAPALAAAGIDPQRLLVVRTRSPQETLWATEQALRSAACGAVLAWPAAPRYPDLRRLQIAAEKSSGLAVLFRAPHVADEASPAPLRLCPRHRQRRPRGARPQAPRRAARRAGAAPAAARRTPCRHDPCRSCNGSRSTFRSCRSRSSAHPA
ncbi:MAG: translesion DNA synthesis-associated protein ImuA [Burkholderiales bacterium]|nr:translesion DNA synthesis-associated protein ImuA [Burkholderiales bacterium]